MIYALNWPITIYPVLLWKVIITWRRLTRNTFCISMSTSMFRHIISYKRFDKFKLDTNVYLYAFYIPRSNSISTVILNVNSQKQGAPFFWCWYVNHHAPTIIRTYEHLLAGNRKRHRRYETYGIFAATKYTTVHLVFFIIFYYKYVGIECLQWSRVTANFMKPDLKCGSLS